MARSLMYFYFKFPYSHVISINIISISFAALLIVHNGKFMSFYNSRVGRKGAIEAFKICIARLLNRPGFMLGGCFVFWLFINLGGPNRTCRKSSLIARECTANLRYR